MDFEIVLAAEIGLTSSQFVTAWNHDPRCRATAEARVEAVTAVGYFLDPALVAAGVAVLGSVASGVSAAIIYDLIKGALADRGIRKRTSIVELKGPDGSRLLVVTVVEEGS